MDQLMKILLLRIVQMEVLSLIEVRHFYVMINEIDSELEQFGESSFYLLSIISIKDSFAIDSNCIEAEDNIGNPNKLIPFDPIVMKRRESFGKKIPFVIEKGVVDFANKVILLQNSEGDGIYLL
ncbi:MAG: hypothetical protein EZS28_048651 [Streblomastix strix]|uniref:Uncharacterized protein n=1 Tax=Streblomastix strix TaxID=222440 RepID=A0A5J4TDI7_9EUKA|nr:MAG: hypothetical protein EZS28_048651 [Streblomastix strix]